MGLDHEWVTIPECCAYMRRSRWTIYEFIRKGLLRASQISPGARIFISRRSIEDLMSHRMNRPKLKESNHNPAPSTVSESRFGGIASR